MLQRHREELPNLTFAEWQELAAIQFHLLRVMKDIRPSRREYLCCFAEKVGFRHLRFHPVPKTPAFSDEYAGSKSFKYINPEPGDVVSAAEVSSLCDSLHSEFYRAYSVAEVSTPPLVIKTGPV